MAITKWSIPVEAISASSGMSQAFATSPLPLRSARALLHPAEDIGSALKASVDVCQRQLVNEVFGPLVTKFVSNFGREDATPIQRGSNASLLGRVQGVKLIRHRALRHLRAAPLPVGSLLSAPGSKLVPRQTPLAAIQAPDPPGGTPLTGRGLSLRVLHFEPIGRVAGTVGRDFSLP